MTMVHVSVRLILSFFTITVLASFAMDHAMVFTLRLIPFFSFFRGGGGIVVFYVALFNVSFMFVVSIFEYLCFLLRYH